MTLFQICKILIESRVCIHSLLYILLSHAHAKFEYLEFASEIEGWTELRQPEWHQQFLGLHLHTRNPLSIPEIHTCPVPNSPATTHFQLSPRSHNTSLGKGWVRT
ncbi:hypothetical protein V6Z12_A12G077000 [Gossypium hirsutum]